MLSRQKVILCSDAEKHIHIHQRCVQISKNKLCVFSSTWIKLQLYKNQTYTSVGSCQNADGSLLCRCLRSSEKTSDCCCHITRAEKGIVKAEWISYSSSRSTSLTGECRQWRRYKLLTAQVQQFLTVDTFNY